ncbi:ABC transporter [Photobacterium iliopiscarium]|uniref:ABC transporter permease n=1 Tax=Photobacterium iliopiscarium TaxID=56192 RepID=A0ABX5GX17_9GAMM|nr:ABC transporter permease [Photobacterium iliopiscarium]KJG24719.1 ABC transporter [Photobacterium iliopiscarium]PSW99611.1 ABC transporter permease [Photobacterium iliopiscarium]
MITRLWWSLLRINAIVSKELRQLSRDRITFGMIVMIPLIQLLLFGYAINTNVRNVPTAIVDQSHSATGRMLVESIKATQVVDVIASYATPQQGQQAIMDGTVKAVLVLPPDFQRRIGPQQVIGQWLVDGSDALISSTIMQLQKMPLTEVIPQRKVQPNNFEVTLYFNPERRSAINIIPGLLGIILTMTMILFTSVTIVREREEGNLELLITTPIQPLELMLAKIIPYIFIGIIQSIIILGLGYVIFDVPINGSLVQIFLGTVLFILASLTLGLVISTKQLQAMQMTIFILLPSILLSGFMFPYEGMPVVAQWIAEVLPTTHFIRIIRGIVLRGADLVDLWRDTLWLVIFTIIGLIIASIRFKKTLD